MTDLSEVRARAWKTRRAKYGPQGHNGYGFPKAPKPDPLEIECEDGYPLESSLRRLRRAKLSPREAEAFLLGPFKRACESISTCSYETKRGVDRMDHPTVQIHFSTGGWSGAEDLVGVMLGQPFIKRLHVQWARGGHYVFEVLDRTA